MGEQEQRRPRWAKTLGETTWTRINELVADGFPAAEIARDVALPADKLRSLQIYVREQGPRRRLNKFAEFKDALLANVEEFGGKFSRGLSTIAEMAISPGTEPALQVRAFEAMNKFTATITAMMEAERTACVAKQGDADDGEKDPSKVMADVLRHYGRDGEG